jgi:hypothetical protein
MSHWTRDLARREMTWRRICARDKVAHCCRFGQPALGDPEITIAPARVSPGWLARNIVSLDESRQSHLPLKMSHYESL